MLNLKFKFDELLKSYSYLSILLLLIPAFINFDSHHDGLILSTALKLRKALDNGGAWPFNQYGQLWAFPYALLSFVVSDQYLLISMRLLTFLYYLATAGLIYKVSARFLSGAKIRIPVLLYLLAQPFALGLNSTFLPWPSALCVLLITLALERLTAVGQSFFLKQASYFFTGVLILGILSTRLQVGVLMILSISALLLVHKKINLLICLLSGFTLSIVIVGFYMQSQGWLRDSLYDSMIFTSQYINSDTSTYPIPRITFLLSFLFLIIIIAFNFTLQKRKIAVLLSRKNLKASKVILFGCILCVSIFGSLFFSNFMTLLIRRTWISFTIASSFTLSLLLRSILQEKEVFLSKIIFRETFFFWYLSAPLRRYCHYLIKCIFGGGALH